MFEEAAKGDGAAADEAKRILSGQDVDPQIIKERASKALALRYVRGMQRREEARSCRWDARRCRSWSPSSA